MADAWQAHDNPNGRLEIFRYDPGPIFEVFHWSRSQDSGANLGHFSTRQEAVRFALRCAEENDFGLPSAEVVDLAAWRAGHD